MELKENGSESFAHNDSPALFRIFLASPGDVPLERKLAREAIQHISNERRFRGRINIEIVAWDQPGAAVAMEAGLTPQEAISQGLPKPQDCDLAVIIFWSRIGTQLPADYELKEDGSPYLSGTEWEYFNALEGYKSDRKPAVWIYRRNGAPQLAVDDPERDAKIDQWQMLEGFFAAFTNPDNSLAGGINYYEKPDDFRQNFENHLRDRLDKLLETIPATDTIQPDSKLATIAPGWTASPYPGLEAFTPEQAPIYFGRGQEVDQLLEHFANPQVHFVAVVGISGSGKSSFVKAGLLPRLRNGIIDNTRWIDLNFKPAERGANPYLAMAYSLKSELNISGISEQELAREMQADGSVAQKHLSDLLAQHKQSNNLLLVIDQFEELFTQCSPNERKDFLVLMDNIVKQPSIRIIITLRADFYARAIEEPILAKLLRQDRGTFPLDPPGLSAIHQMIIRPAEAAGIELQDGLAQRLLDDAGEGPGAMALIAFTLNQLYQQEHNTAYLSIDGYEAIGGVQGAVQKRAETVLKSLSVNTDKGLPNLFVHLVEVNEQEVATRRRALQSKLKGDTETVANALIEARLLVTGKGEDQQPTVEVAHETVLNGWEKLGQWIRDHAEFLRARRDLERVASEWEKSGRHGSALRTGKMLQRYLDAAEPRTNTANEYLAACKRHRAWVHTTYATLGLLVIAMLGLLFEISKSSYPPALAAKALFVDWGVWPVTPPQMVKISIGEFEMGDPEGQSNEQPVHTVRFDAAFEIGRYEVTFEEYDLFAAATGRDKPSDRGWGRGQQPAINVSWYDASVYAQWLSDKIDKNYRLPTEAEWEYAARSGSKSRWFWGDNEDGAFEFAWFSSNSGSESHPVGDKKPNGFDLHDMAGNVWEWTQDCYINNYRAAPDDGSAQEAVDNGECARRVLRGGSWGLEPLFIRSASRFWFTPGNRGYGIGFRLARTF
jgi:formylglycine-generating enzyme required for sulfatase activity